jgi:hypothetical protein
MILPASEPASLAAYKKLKQENGSVPVRRPEKCPSGRDCSGRMWSHTAYKRKAKDSTGEEVELEIRRFRCSDCNLVVSCLFCFLVPYVQYVAEAVSEWIAFYLETSCTYDELEWGGDIDVRSTAYRKVEYFAEQASQLSMQVQTESILNGSEENLDTPEEPVICPNSWKAYKEGKSAQLDRGATVLQYCRILMKTTMRDGAGILERINQYFLTSAESLQSIYCAREKISLSNQHTVKCSLC